MRFRNLVRKYGRRFVSVASVPVALVYSGASSAAVDAAVTTALSDGATDAKTIAAAAFAIVLGIVVFKYFRKAI